MLELSDCIHTVTASSVASPNTVIPKGNTSMTSVVIPVIQNSATSSIPPVLTQSGDIETSTASVLSSNLTPIAPLTISTGGSVIAKQGTEKVIIEKTIEFRGSTTLSLPKNPNTLLGYDSRGTIITVGIGTGVSLIG